MVFSFSGNEQRVLKEHPMPVISSQISFLKRLAFTHNSAWSQRCPLSFIGVKHARMQTLFEEGAIED
jgi:hypothetical protein